MKLTTFILLASMSLGLSAAGKTAFINSKVLLEQSPTRHEQNNIANNADWAIKVLDGQEPVQAAHNWWGKENFDQDKMIIGPVNIHPVLSKPVAVQMLE